MANIILSSRSGNDWTRNELHALNITVVPLDPIIFFGMATLPNPTVDPILFQDLARPAGAISKENRLFFRYLRDVSGLSTKSAVDDFAAFLLKLLDYDEPGRVVRQLHRPEISFLMSGRKVDATPDVVVMDEEDYILLLQGYKSDSGGHEAEPRLIAAAVAAHYENNRRRRALGLPVVPSKVFAGIVVTGTALTFYKIPISEDLLDAISRAQYPTAPTVVHKLVPPVPNLHKYLSEGMVSLDNRRIVFQCLEAFRQFVI
ncbi:hypothetical protein DFH07DRAFT_290430 [Mycena maculata]|uniref:Uncharacterized protein n=1 Tax=Mycena maculata TaxID=230809 RepID=A0AAD7JPN0_9AGAR|nr:hypothetical protein DFH07DRAFT_290430 [Mycena maculata]